MEPMARQALVDVLRWGKLQEDREHVGIERV